MKNPDYLKLLYQDLLSRTVTDTRLAANSLILYIDCKPGDTSGFTIWFSPTWHVKGKTGVLVGSRQVQTDEDDNEMEAFERGAKALLALHNRKILKVKIEPLTYDLHLKLDEDFWVKTFVSDPEDEESWHIHDLTNKKKIIGSPHGIIQLNDK